MAINAISDAYLLVDAPDCANPKILYIQGNHDMNSTLSSVSGHHRVANTDLHPTDMIASREDSIEETLLRMAKFRTASVLFFTSMPMATITGVDYDRLVISVAGKTGKQIVHVPGKSLSGDWLDGYSEALCQLAKGIDLSNASPDSSKVAIVGYLMDRNEEDHRANIRELKKLLRALGIDVCTIWLNGGKFDNLARVKEAGAIISLPYGRKAATILARKLQIPIIETELPFGIRPTISWLEKISCALGKQDKLQALIDTELDVIIPRLEWIVQFYFLHRKIIFMGDPHLYKGLLDMAEELGMEISLAILTCRRGHLKTMHSDPDGCQLLFEPKMNEMHSIVSTLLEEKNIHLVVGCSDAKGLQVEGAYIEFGYPSFFTHFLYDRPFLGFNGALSFIEKMANSMRLSEARNH